MDMQVESETDATTTTDHRLRVVIDSRARAVLRQLAPNEQAAVHDALEVIAREGLDAHRRDYHVVVMSGVATMSDATGPYYAFRVRGAPDIRVFARISGARTMTVIDVLRQRTLRNVAHSF